VKPFSRKLLIKGSPESDESLLGFVLRLTEENGYESPTWILKSAGLDPRPLSHTCSSLFKSNEKFELLAQVTGASVSDLIRLTYPRIELPGSAPRYLFFGSPLPQFVIRAIRPKICPRCLLETGYCRRIWDLLFVTVCPIHECALIDVCPNCKRRLSWIRSNVSVCLCNYDWRKSPRQPIKKSELIITRHIYQLCGLPIPEYCALSVNSRNPILALNLQSFVMALLFILTRYAGITAGGRESLGGKGGKQNSELHILCKKAFSFFEEWPERFYLFLDLCRIDSTTSFEPSHGLKSWLYRGNMEIHVNLYKELQAEQYFFMKKAVSNYLAKKYR
jgi:hypothetical protein